MKKKKISRDDKQSEQPFYLKPLNIPKTTTHDDRNPDHGLGQAQKGNRTLCIIKKNSRKL